MLEIADSLKEFYPGGFIGVLALSGMNNLEECTPLEIERQRLEAELRVRFAGSERSDLKLLEPIKTYAAYYARFRKTYHVLLQLESVVFKNKAVPSVNPLVEIMFMAELKNQLLTAGHDLDTMSLPMRARLTNGTEHFTGINGQDKCLPEGDMAIEDGQGIISNITYGPDQRTQITADTKRVVYTVYAPPGIELPLIQAHFKDIIRYAGLVSPQASVELEEIYSI